jgi:two-component system chemotaxis response regulator CheY
MATVLVVDDEEAIRDFFSKVLTKMGHSVLGVARNGPEAIVFCRSQAPDFILMDVLMPDAPDGIGATSQILKQYPATKVLICSGVSSAVEASVRAGARGFLEKPFDSRTLHEAITLILDGGEFFPSREFTDKNASEIARLSFPSDLLSRKELRVLTLIGCERTDEEIARELGLALDAIETLRQTMMVKLGGRRAPDLRELGRTMIKRGPSAT